MKRNFKFNLNISNIAVADHIQDWIFLMKETLGKNLTISTNYDPKKINLILEDFSMDKDIGNLITFKNNFPNSKVICFLTEFMEKNTYVMNSFKKKQITNTQLYNDITYNKKTFLMSKLKKFKNYLTKLILKILIFINNNTKIRISLFDDRDIIKIEREKKRLKNLKIVNDFIDFYLCGYDEQIEGWSTTILKDIIIFPYYLTKKNFLKIKTKLVDHENKFMSYGTYTKFREKVCNYYFQFNKKVFFSNNFLKFNDLLKILEYARVNLIIPQNKSILMTSSIKTWLSLRMGTLPINIIANKRTYFEKALDIPTIHPEEFALFDDNILNNHIKKIKQNFDIYFKEHSIISNKFFEKLNDR